MLNKTENYYAESDSSVEHISMSTYDIISLWMPLIRMPRMLSMSNPLIIHRIDLTAVEGKGYIVLDWYLEDYNGKVVIAHIYFKFNDCKLLNVLIEGEKGMLPYMGWMSSDYLKSSLPSLNASVLVELALSKITENFGSVVHSINVSSRGCPKKGVHLISDEFWHSKFKIIKTNDKHNKGYVNISFKRLS